MPIQGGNREAVYAAMDEASSRYPRCVWSFCYLSWNVNKLKVVLLLTFVKKNLLFEEKWSSGLLYAPRFKHWGEYTDDLQTPVSLLYVVRWSLITQIARSTNREKRPSLELPSQLLAWTLGIKNTVSSGILSNLSGLWYQTGSLTTFSRNLPIEPTECWGYQEFHYFSVLFWWRLKRGGSMPTVQSVRLTWPLIGKNISRNILSIIILLLCKHWISIHFNRVAIVGSCFSGVFFPSSFVGRT